MKKLKTFLLNVLKKDYSQYFFQNDPYNKIGGITNHIGVKLARLKIMSTLANFSNKNKQSLALVAHSQPWDESLLFYEISLFVYLVY